MAATVASRANRNALGTTDGNVCLHDDLIGKEETDTSWDNIRKLVKAKAFRGSNDPALLSPRENHVLKQGNVSKLTSHHDWVKKVMTVSQTQLTLSDNSNTHGDSTRTVFQDYIPLHEISRVELSVRPIEDESGILKTPSADASEAAANNNRLRAANTFKGFFRREVFAEKGMNMFEVQTNHHGLHAGRVYVFMADSPANAKEWVAFLTERSKLRIQEVQNQTMIQRWRDRASRVYEHSVMQTLVALLILFSFGINVYQAEYSPETLVARDAAHQNDDHHVEEDAEFYNNIETGLTVVFAAELAFNMFAHWFWPFFLDNWSIFDLVIVSLSMVSMLVPSLPGLSFLRVLRAFRVVRLIKRLKSLKRIFSALVRSIMPVFYAFAICVLITFIYSIMGVFLLSEQSGEDFGTFNRSLMTLFMLVATGTWPVERLPLFAKNGNIDKVVATYLFSFVVVVLWTCLQVVVAVLLDNFLSATAEDKVVEAMKYQDSNRKMRSPLEPLLKKLAANFDTANDLRRDIQVVFRILDVDDSGALSDQEMLAGFGKLKLTPKIIMTADECKAMKTQTLACAEDTELSLELFQKLMLSQLRDYVQRIMHDAYKMNEGDPATTAQMCALKLLLVPDTPDTGQESDIVGRMVDMDGRMVKLQHQVESFQLEMRGQMDVLQGHILTLVHQQSGRPTSTHSLPKTDDTLRVSSITTAPHMTTFSTNGQDSDAEKPLMLPRSVKAVSYEGMNSPIQALVHLCRDFPRDAPPSRIPKFVAENLLSPHDTSQIATAPKAYNPTPNVVRHSESGPPPSTPSYEAPKLELGGLCSNSRPSPQGAVLETDTTPEPEATPPQSRGQAAHRHWITLEPENESKPLPTRPLRNANRKASNAGDSSCNTDNAPLARLSAAAGVVDSNWLKMVHSRSFNT